ncbi:MAG: class I SAM-dependent methyltransferase, partial [Ureaplasma sp.]|nr:class I SAM-dependent methyltransferase [Ureaplasma sp.]
MQINKELFDICSSNNIPIIRKKTENFIINLVQKNNFKTILEIGTAYGYSAHIWSQIPSITKVVTIEKSIESYKIAKKYLSNYKNVFCINFDAFELKLDEKFDLILIDGPKSHQDILVEKYLHNLNRDGIMVIDNLFLKKIADLKLKTKKQEKLLNKIDSF